MPTTAQTLKPGYVLHQRAYRETSAIVEVLTREEGRVGVVARGVRAQRGKARPPLQPFQRYLFGWRGRGELMNLTTWELNGSHRYLQGSGLVSGLYLNELLVRLLQRDDPHPAVFDAYVVALTGLAEASTRQLALRAFEKRLLSAIGYGLELNLDVESGSPLSPATLYLYDPDAGPRPAPPNAQSGGLCVHGATLLAVDEDRLETEQARREAKGLMRALLHHYLQGRPLISRTLLRG
ncbi:MAG: DNA repair protein RecO [Chromatiales bacterium]|nr:DNA repair protein RecO [Chromatiales bacterium]